MKNTAEKVAYLDKFTARKAQDEKLQLLATLYQPAFRAVIFHTWHLALEAKTKLLV